MKLTTGEERHPEVAVKAAHRKLSHSRMPFVRADFRETQELIFGPSAGHPPSFAWRTLGQLRPRQGVRVLRRDLPARIYDDIKTAVEAIFVGKARQHNRRFLQMCSHHSIEPVACTPAAGWEKGQVENGSARRATSCSAPSRG